MAQTIFFSANGPSGAGLFSTQAPGYAVSTIGNAGTNVATHGSKLYFTQANLTQCNFDGSGAVVIAGGFAYEPEAIAIAPDGSYALLTDPVGGHLNKVTIPGGSVSVLKTLADVYSVCFDGSGNLFVATGDISGASTAHV